MLGRWFQRPDPRLNPAAVRFDLHNHILPGVDDGAPDLDHALASIRALIDLGYRGAILTPHIQHDLFDNSEEALREAFLQLLPHVRQAFPSGFDLALGAEYFLDNRLMDSLESRPEKLLSFGPGRSLLLIEFPTISLPTFITDLLSCCRRAHLTPIIAHPERYADIQFDRRHENVQGWRAAGALIQVNLGSLAGQYDARARDTALALGKAGLVDFIGTDLHRPTQVPHYTQPGWHALARARWAFDPTRQQSLFPASPAPAPSAAP